MVANNNSNSSIIIMITAYVYVLHLPYRIDLLNNSFYRFETDGLNTLNYKIKSLKILPLFTHFLVDLDE
jgi:hypothetical protein